MTRTEHRRSVAGIRLREAHVPSNVMSAEHLAAFPSYQWGSLIALARRVYLARLAEAAANPVRRFLETYRKERGTWPL